MFVICSTCNEQVIEVHKDEMEITNYFIQQPLEGLSSVSKSESHADPLGKSERSGLQSLEYHTAQLGSGDEHGLTHS